VIVGETWNDLQITDVGTMTGATLQANYIASLLDESILRPVPRSLDYATSAFWLVVIFWIFYGWKPEFPELAAVVSLFVTFVLGVGFTSVIAKQWGIFADVVPPTLLEIIGLYLARRTEMLSSSKV
jgi:CHASE2 domain-containing sensor protein